MALSSLVANSSRPRSDHGPHLTRRPSQIRRQGQCVGVPEAPANSACTVTGSARPGGDDTPGPPEAEQGGQQGSPRKAGCAGVPSHVGGETEALADGRAAHPAPGSEMQMAPCRACHPNATTFCVSRVQPTDSAASGPCNRSPGVFRKHLLYTFCTPSPGPGPVSLMCPRVLRVGPVGPWLTPRQCRGPCGSGLVLPPRDVPLPPGLGLPPRGRGSQGSGRGGPRARSSPPGVPWGPRGGCSPGPG